MKTKRLTIIFQQHEWLQEIQNHRAVSEPSFKVAIGQYIFASISFHFHIPDKISQYKRNKSMQSSLPNMKRQGGEYVTVIFKGLLIAK